RQQSVLQDRSQQYAGAEGQRIRRQCAQQRGQCVRAPARDLRKSTRSRFEPVSWPRCPLGMEEGKRRTWTNVYDGFEAGSVERAYTLAQSIGESPGLGEPALMNRCCNLPEGRVAGVDQNQAVASEQLRQQ